MKKSTLLIFLLSLNLFTIALSAQSDYEQTIIDIKTKLKVEYGKNFLITIFNPNDVENLNYFVQDENNLLDSCLVFLAYEYYEGDIGSPYNLIGVYKNADILWHSKQIINGEIIVSGGSNFYKDLNSDGKIEIVTGWLKSMSATQEDLWIVSCDGNTGKVVNNYDENGNSKIQTVTDSYEIIDVEGDGIFEIKAKSVTDNTAIIYNWFDNTIGNIQTIAPVIIPRNYLTVKVSSEVSRSNDVLNYKYKVYNFRNSIQDIESFCIASNVPKLIIDKKPNNWDAFNVRHKEAIRWNVKFPIEIYFDYLIKPGKLNDSFVLKGNFLPIITKYYIQGNNGKVNIYLSDIFINSKTGFTIGQAEVQMPLDKKSHMDSLINYTQESLKYGWIENEQTKNKYKNYLITAKNYLTEGDSTSARNELQLVLNDCVADSSTVLTSEAFALLYFNTEYLIKQLPIGEK